MCATTAATTDIQLAWDNGKLKLVAPRVVAAPVGPIDPAIVALFARMPDPYADAFDDELAAAFVGGLLGEAP